MINPRLFRDDIESIFSNLKRRHQSDQFSPQTIQDRIQTITKLQPENDALKNERNQLSKKIGELKRAKQNADTEMDRMQEISTQIKKNDELLQGLQKENDTDILAYPNILFSEVPDGKNEAENVEIKVYGNKPDFSFSPLSHDDLGEKLGILDFDAGSKITGSKFPVYHGLGASLERAIVNFMLDIHTQKNGYEETFVPLLVNDDSMVGTGQYPKFMDEYYRLDKDNLSLIPTAEVPLTNLFRDSILENLEAPVKITAYSSCFRREAGSYGKETKGLVRVHQFQKVELVKICRPDQSAQEHESLLANAEMILQQLGLPYRVMLLCAGDTSAASAKTYDIEVWMPGLDKYLEISSVSNFADYQARRARIRYRAQAKGKPEICHTLNGSGLAAGRTMAAIMENCQNQDGSINIPDVLQPYMNGLTKIK